MAAMGWCTIILVVSMATLVHAGQWTVNSVGLTTCTSNTRLSMDTTNSLAVDRGVPNAPCTGYLQLNTDTGTASSQRMCSVTLNETDSVKQYLDKAAAERACYTMGNNLHRRASDGKAIILYTCAPYTGKNVQVPSTGNESVAGVMRGAPGASLGRQCKNLKVDTNCYDDCYISDIFDNSTGSHQLLSEVDCDQTNPYWAITCTDQNECDNGVLDDCISGFADSSCTSRKACGPNTDCTNEVGSWLCECEEGFENANADALDPYNITVGCKDIDECLNLTICGFRGQCTNQPGSYKCICLVPEHYDNITNTCKGGECLTIPTVENALAPNAVAPVAYNDRLIYICNEGYRVVPSASSCNHSLEQTYPGRVFEITCNAYGDYGPACVPSCEPVDCGTPDRDGNARETPASANYWVNSTVEYTCDSGFLTQENATSYVRTCQENGTWTEGSRCNKDIDECWNKTICGFRGQCGNNMGSYTCTCLVPEQYEETNKTCTGGWCQTLPTVENAQPNATAPVNYNETAAYVCNEGYRADPKGPDGANPLFQLYPGRVFEITCNAYGGYGPARIPTCQPVDCGSPGADANAEEPPPWPRYGFTSRVKFTCNSGFLTWEDTPSYERTCQENGTWTVGSKCGKDIDECLTPDVCGFRGQCRNLEGTYICTCLVPEHYNKTSNTCVGGTCLTIPEVANTLPSPNLTPPVVYNDKIIFICKDGYRVVPRIPDGTSVYYQTYPKRVFEIACNAYGDFGPNSLPRCEPVDCGTPVGELNVQATPATAGYEFQSTVTYNCNEGFTTKEFKTSYSRTCQANGTWTQVSTCSEDIDECKNSTICGKVSKYCINTIGSYLCSCVPWHMKNVADDRCIEWAGHIDFPHYLPCEIMDTLGMCLRGTCQLTAGKAWCKCEPGYDGVACDRKVISQALIIGIIALALSGAVIGWIILRELTGLAKRARKIEAAVSSPQVPPQYGENVNFQGMIKRGRFSQSPYRLGF